MNCYDCKKIYPIKNRTLFDNRLYECFNCKQIKCKECKYISNWTLYHSRRGILYFCSEQCYNNFEEIE